MQRLLLRLACFAVRIYYRVDCLGAGVPAEGPVVLVGNHPNGLVDPIVLASTTDRPVRFLGKAPLFDMPGLGAVMRGLDALPVYRSQDGADTALNETTFEAVYSALLAGDLVCLFPEGKSHDEPETQRLKTGAARMALGAEHRAAFELGVRVLPVGLVYRAKRRFRSRVATWVGRPIDTRDLKELFARDEREAVRVLTERIAAGLGEVTLSLDRWEDLPLLELAERIWRPEEGNRLERIHRFAEVVRTLRTRDAARVDALSDRISAFRDRLRHIGLSVDDLAIRYDLSVLLRFCARTLFVLLVALPLASVGSLFWLPPYLLVPYVARLLRPSRSIYATVQIVAGIVLFPLWWIAAAVAAGIYSGWPGALSVVVLAPPLGLLALWFLGWRRETTADVAAFLVLARRKRLRELLRQERDDIAREIDALRAERTAVR